jgi:hypothetical protein
MTDVEELLREELRARVDAAEAARTDIAPAVRLTELDTRIRRIRLRRRRTGAVLSAAVIAAGVTLPVALRPGPVVRAGPHGPGAALPLTGTAATPAGWAAVAHGDAQISVPARWLVASTPQCGRRIPGYVVLGPASTNLVVRNPRCRQAQNMAAILIGRTSGGHGAHLATKINGIAVESVQIVPSADGSVSYFVPALHVTVTAHGPLARRVLATLTRSPLSVVLEAGPRSPVPHSWRWHEFRGIRFAAPGGWALDRNGHWGCPPFSAPDSVVLIPAANFRRPRCAVVVPTAGLMTGHAGVVAGAGPYRGSDTFLPGSCRRLHGLRACYLTPAYGDQTLDVAVYVPGRDRATELQIGLGGSGVIPRTIVQSIRPG